ncbi:hypothetical protein BD770DRAFT_414906 [Pilaira anomala]|nr:hypothetical protein BD770DRAFT_414906 [Pilaira anomala]
MSSSDEDLEAGEVGTLKTKRVAESFKSSQTRIIIQETINQNINRIFGTVIPNEIFSQKFWYSVCMLIFGNLSSQELQVKYSSVPNIGRALDQYFQDYPLSKRPLSG